MNPIVFAIVVVVVLGLAGGVILVLASKFMAVYEDPRIAQVAECLAGAFAANTTLPVVGIPMKGGAMDGLDALLATVQMPSGFPVATVALNGAKNAAYLAVAILAVADDELAAKLDQFRADTAAAIAKKDAAIAAEAAAM